jgi:hypothetical protein
MKFTTIFRLKYVNYESVMLICNYVTIAMVVMENNISYNKEIQNFAT